MATKWPEKRRVIGKSIARLDGPAKATGTAKYSFDINRPRLLHAVMLRCPHAHASAKADDTAEAENTPGFNALHIVSRVVTELFYAGAEVLAIAADTEEHAHDAIRAVKVEYDPMPFVVKEADTLAQKVSTAGPGSN